MSSITEVKKNASKKLSKAEKIVTNCKKMIEKIQKLQELAEEMSELECITDGDYLKFCNDNKKQMESVQKELRIEEEKIITLTYLKKHGQYPKIEFSDSDSD